jgi:hypothetical protein
MMPKNTLFLIFEFSRAFLFQIGYARWRSYEKVVILIKLAHETKFSYKVILYLSGFSKKLSVCF